MGTVKWRAESRRQGEPLHPPEPFSCLKCYLCVDRMVPTAPFSQTLGPRESGDRAYQATSYTPHPRLRRAELPLSVSRPNKCWYSGFFHPKMETQLTGMGVRGVKGQSSEAMGLQVQGD